MYSFLIELSARNQVILVAKLVVYSFSLELLFQIGSFFVEDTFCLTLIECQIRLLNGDPAT